MSYTRNDEINLTSFTSASDEGNEHDLSSTFSSFDISEHETDQPAINHASDTMEPVEQDSSEESAEEEIVIPARADSDTDTHSDHEEDDAVGTDAENSDHDIEALEPIQPNRQNFAEHFLKTVGTASALAFITPNAAYALTVTIASGRPNEVETIAKYFAEFAIPSIAVVDATTTTLHMMEKPWIEKPHLAILSIRSGIGVTNFLVPMTMEFYTFLFEVIKHIPFGSEVDMPDWAAALLISACFSIGALQSFNTLFTEINKQRNHVPLNEAVIAEAEPTRLQRYTQNMNWFFTNKHMKRTLGFFNGAASIHGATMVIESAIDAFSANHKSLDTAAYFYPRMAATFGSGALSAVILGQDNAEDLLSGKITNVILTIAKLLALLANVSDTFYVSQGAEKVFGKNVIHEQSILWVAIPYIPIILLLLDLKGPAMLQALNNMLDSIIEYCQFNRPEVREQDLPLISEDPASYGSINADTTATPNNNVPGLLTRFSSFTRPASSENSSSDDFELAYSSGNEI